MGLLLKVIPKVLVQKVGFVLCLKVKIRKKFSSGSKGTSLYYAGKSLESEVMTVITHLNEIADAYKLSVEIVRYMQESGRKVTVIWGNENIMTEVFGTD